MAADMIGTRGKLLSQHGQTAGFGKCKVDSNIQTWIFALGSSDPKISWKSARQQGS